MSGPLYFNVDKQYNAAMKKSSLKTFAGIIWVAAGGMLLYRGADMLRGVWTLDKKFVEGVEATSHTLLIVYAVIGLLIGAAKGFFVLSKSAKRNSDRIDRIEGPVRPWQVFALKFIPLIAVMIGMGIGIRALAANPEVTWISWGGCGAVYVGIGAALFASSLVYFKKKMPLV